MADKLGLAEVLTLLEVFMQGFHVVRLAVDILEMLGVLRSVVVGFVDERHRASGAVSLQGQVLLIRGSLLVRVTLDLGLRKLPSYLISLLSVLLAPISLAGLSPFELVV